MLRYALRQLWKDRGASFVVVLTIALGIGVNTAVFSMLNGFERPLPAKSPEQVVVIAADTKGDETGFRFQFSFAQIEDFRRQADSFSEVFAFTPRIDGISDGGNAYEFLDSAVTGNYFSALGIQPALGRFFEPGEGENAAAEMNVVLGYAFWQKKFGGDRSVIGRHVRVDGRLATVIGVAPKDFHGTYAGASFDGWLPLRIQVSDEYARSQQYFSDREARSLTVFGRLKPKVRLEQAQESMTALARHMELQYPDTDRGIGIRVLPEPRARPIPLKFVTEALPFIRFFLLLLAGLVLLLACLNVANILLVRGTVREREMAVRMALGSGRWRLIGHMLAESMVLALIGAAAGMIAGIWTTHAFWSSLDFGTNLPIFLDFRFDWRVFGYALSAAVITGIIVGAWPAARASQTNAGAALHDGSRTNSGGPARQRGRSLLVVGQVAGSLVLLVGAGLFVRSLQNANRIDLGFAPDHVLNATLNPHWAGYNAQRSKDFFHALRRRVDAWPEVQSSSLALCVPLGYINANARVYLDGRPVPPDRQVPMVGSNYIEGAYFETMQIALVRGRAFRETDKDGAPRVAIINQTMAERYWPNEDPIGKRFRPNTPDTPLTEVVGVVKDSKYLALFEKPLPHVYIPSDQDFGPLRTLQIRTTVPPETLINRLRETVRELDPDMPIGDLQTMSRSLGGLQGFLIFRVGAMQAGLLGLLGLTLAVVGVYGVVSYGATQRTREIGIRMALGAVPRDILRIILGQGIWLVVSGVVLGLAGAAAMARLLERFLLLVSATDPLTFIAVTLLLASAALCACYLPARRATRVEPVVALRHE
jgi:predicted permease